MIPAGFQASTKARASLHGSTCLQDMHHHLLLLRSFHDRGQLCLPLLAVFGMPPLVAGVPISIAISESERSYLPWIGGECLILGPVFIALGLFAYSRYISAMIVGCLIWMYMASGFLPSFRRWGALIRARSIIFMSSTSLHLCC
jgi:hypothetical protein